MDPRMTIGIEPGVMKPGDIIEFHWAGESGEWTEYCKVMQVEGTLAFVVRDVDPTEVAWKSLLESE